MPLLLCLIFLVKSNIFLPKLNNNNDINNRFASLSGAFISIVAVTFFFVEFKGHEVLGAIWMAILAIVAGIETFLDYSVGCVVFG
jgi:Domain of unknown function (DUF4395)